MDIASLIGLIGTLGMIAGAMISSGGLGMFIDTPSMLIVIGGTFFAVMYRSTLPMFLGSWGTLVKVFMPGAKKHDELITRLTELAGIARKDGMMALEGQEVPDKFFEKGLQMLVDGADETKLTEQLKGKWRLPKRHELENLVCHKCDKVKIKRSIFPNTPPESFWTSEINKWQPRFMWTVNFFTGHTFGRFPSYIPNYVRLVRDR